MKATGKTIMLIIIFLLTAGLIGVSFLLFAPSKKMQGNLNPLIHPILKQLGDSALQTNDVPVAAVILYNNEIISTGYNTVLRNQNIAAHAEINAINNLIHRIGADSLRHITSSLTLVSSWEPCTMCMGAVIESGIKQVIILKPKSFLHKLKEEKNRFLYQLHKKTVPNDTLQIHLFRKHPLFGEQDTASF